MVDRELLELAAKANWRQELADDEVLLRYSERDEGMLYLHADNQDHNGQDREFVWNPLTQNHDALELAVKLHIDLTVNNGTATAVWVDMDLSETHECFEYCDEAFEGIEAKVAAARRAIVRAAAEIGRNKEQGDWGGV